MPTYSTIQIVGGVEQTFAQWNVAMQPGPLARKRNQAADLFNCTVVVASLAAEIDDPTFPFEAQIIVRVNRIATTPVNGPTTYSAGTVKFIGKRVTAPARGMIKDQSVLYQFQGAWYDLENTDYQQNFAGIGQVQQLIGETILFTGFDQNKHLINISVGDAIQDIVQFILTTYAAQGLPAPFQYAGRALTHGAIDLSTTLNAPAQSTPQNQTFQFYTGTKTWYVNQVPANASIDLILFASYLPTLICKPMKASEALKKCLEYWPRTNIWFDYTAIDANKNPLPMLYVNTVDNMPPITLPLVNTNIDNVMITPRYDLVARAVVITYRINNSVNGASNIGYAIDKWGPNGFNSPLDPSVGLRVVGELIDLSGFNVTTIQGHLDTEPLVIIGTTQAVKRAWWSSKRGGEIATFLDSRCRFQTPQQPPAEPPAVPPAVVTTTIPDSTIYYASTGGVDAIGNPRVAGQPLSADDLYIFIYRLVRGTQHAWMTLDDGTAVVSLKVRVTTNPAYAIYNIVAPGDIQNQLPVNEDASNIAQNGVLKHASSTREHHANLELTNGITGAYSTIASETPGETYVIGAGGIANYLYEHMAVLQFDGTAVTVEANFQDSTSATYVHPGRSLNLSGGANLWLTMNAQIQEIAEDYELQKTSIKIGVAKHLNSGQLSALFNMWRFRRPWYNPEVRADNTVAGNGNVDMAITAGNANSTDGVDDDNLQAVSAPFTPQS